MEIAYKPKALEDLEYFKKSGNKRIMKKIQCLIFELEKHPEYGSGKPEQLKYNLSGFWARHINDKDRLVYEIDYLSQKVFIYSLRGHYLDK